MSSASNVVSLNSNPILVDSENVENCNKHSRPSDAFYLVRGFILELGKAARKQDVALRRLVLIAKGEIFGVNLPNTEQWILASFAKDTLKAVGPKARIHLADLDRGHCW